MRGRTAFYMAPINTAVGLVNEGRLAALGLSTRRRADVLPNVVPLAEQGFPAYDVSLWFGMWAPAGTPPAVVQKLNAQVASALQNAEVVEQFGKLGISPLPMTPGGIRPLRAQRDRDLPAHRQAGRHPAAIGLTLHHTNLRSPPTSAAVRAASGWCGIRA